VPREITLNTLAAAAAAFNAARTSGYAMDGVRVRGRISQCAYLSLANGTFVTSPRKPIKGSRTRVVGPFWTRADGERPAFRSSAAARDEDAREGSRRSQNQHYSHSVRLH
jgi:hypothetical protein